MDKLIDDIIELILGDVDCHHEIDHDEDGTHAFVEYNLNNETKLGEMIRELIEQYRRSEMELKSKCCGARIKYYSNAFIPLLNGETEGWVCLKCNQPTEPEKAKEEGND